jgi:uncharacterized protein YbaP (TraB family)
VQLSGLTVVKLGYDPAQGVDRVLADAARKAGKQVEGLETPEQQLSLFASAPDDVQLAYLAKVVGELGRVGPTVDQLLQRWSAGDADGVGALLDSEIRSSPRLAKIMIQDRNARWADWIAARMARPGVVFVAVGGGHLGGPGNLRELLAAKGFTIERVRN